MYALTHNIMTMSLKDLHTLPRFVPIPQLDCHIITSSKDKTLGWMDSYSAYVVWVCLEAGNLLRRIVVQNAQLKVVPPPAPTPNPWLVAVVISIATFMQVLDTSIAKYPDPAPLGLQLHPGVKMKIEFRNGWLREL